MNLKDLAVSSGEALRLGASALLMAGIIATAGASDARAEGESVRVGVVTFLSGGAAGPFGVPARNAAELMTQALNDGSVPAPYDSVGFAGAAIEPIYVDENSKQKVADFRTLVQKDEADLIIGYISSGSCKAIAPVVEELKKLTVFFDCGTPQIFEEIVTEPKYLFRTGGHATMDSVAAARYVHEMGGDVKAIAGINQNYAWGQDSWRDFSASMAALGDSEVVSEQFPKIYAGQYGSEISSLLTNQIDVLHSSFWGGDMEAFVLQASARGLFGRTKVVLTTGETAMHRLGKQMPDGTILGARGPHGDLAPESELNNWFRKAYFDRFGTLPTYPSYKMAQAILGVKAAYEKAAGDSGALPDQDAVAAALTGLEFEGPSGKVMMAISNGHQAIQDTAYGVFQFDSEAGKATLTDIRRYPAACVNPPDGVNSLDWITGGFEGAACE